jgi:transposase
MQSRIINQIQRDLRAMNLRLEVALNDVTGKSGRAIIEAILAGERDPRLLAALADYRVKKSKEEIALSLEGNWHEGYLFVLSQHYDEYIRNLDHIQACDNEIEKILKKHLVCSEIAPKDAPRHQKAIKKNKNKPEIDLQIYSFQYFGGVDLFAIEGVNQNTVLSIITEIGTDITKFHSAKAFSNWLHLCPNQKITGGKVISNHPKRGTNPLSQALRSVANVIGNLKSNTHLTRFFKKIAFKKGWKEAITATAHKLAIVIYNMLTKYEPYKPFVREVNEQIERTKKIRAVEKILKEHKIQIEDINISY